MSHLGIKAERTVVKFSLSQLQSHGKLTKFRVHQYKSCLRYIGLFECQECLDKICFYSRLNYRDEIVESTRDIGFGFANRNLCGTFTAAR